MPSTSSGSSGGSHGAGKIAAAPRAPRPTGILPIHACMINSDNEVFLVETKLTADPPRICVVDAVGARCHREQFQAEQARSDAIRDSNITAS